MKAALLVGILAVTTNLCAQQKPENQSAPTTAVSATQVANPEFQVASFPLSAELTRGLDVRKAKPGDLVFAKSTQDLTVNDDVLIPKNTKLVGHIVEVQTRGRGAPESRLGIAFDKTIMRDGREVPLIATIQALTPPPTMASELGDSEFHVRNVQPSKAPASARLLGPLKAVPPAASRTGLPLASAVNTTDASDSKGLQLEAEASNQGTTSVIHSSSHNVRLESGTRLILRVSLP